MEGRRVPDVGLVATDFTHAPDDCGGPCGGDGPGYGMYASPCHIQRIQRARRT
jgi:hypothetical protein